MSAPRDLLTETLAEQMHADHACDHEWLAFDAYRECWLCGVMEGSPCACDERAARYADAILASPALDVLVAERVAALAEEEWVRTPSAMESVCVGTVVRSGSGTIACRYNKDLAVLLGDERPISWRALSLPLQVLWNPRVAALAAIDKEGEEE